ncbi:MAG: hypothetical protein Q8K59_01275 [Nitrosomonas sp.]|nr:hypothetical protein [Nitrosomonas sp.]MDP1949732.1 hypothetical protein [Nitrosomonas sp.]
MARWDAVYKGRFLCHVLLDLNPEQASVRPELEGEWPISHEPAA